MLFRSGVKLGHSHKGKSTDRGCLRTACWEQYMEHRGRKWWEIEEDCIMRNFITCTLHQISLGLTSKGGWDLRDVLHAWKRWEMITIFWSGKLKGRGDSKYSWEDNIRMDLREIGMDVADWMYLSQDQNQWRALINTVMNLQVPQKTENFLTSWLTDWLTDSQEGIRCM